MMKEKHELLKVFAMVIGASQFCACAGPAVFGPAGGLIIPSRDVEEKSVVAEKLVIFNENTKFSAGSENSGLKIYCYRPKDSRPLVARAGLYIKELIFSRDDNQTCQFIGVSQLEIGKQFAIDAYAIDAAKNQVQITDKIGKDDTPKGSKKIKNELDEVASSSKGQQAQPQDAKARLRNQYAAALLNIQEYNCRSFIASAFSTRALADTQKDFISALGTGVSSGTAISSPHFSAALGLTNLVYGSGINSVSKNIYLDKTTDALATAIQSSRLANRATILDNLKSKYDEYPIDSLISDLKSYESLCSINAGATELNRMANQRLTETAKQQQQGESASNEKADKSSTDTGVDAKTKPVTKSNNSANKNIATEPKADSSMIKSKSAILSRPGDGPAPIIVPNKLPSIGVAE